MPDIIDSKRRWFLSGRFNTEHGTLRPPWAVAEAGFIERCIRCGDCARACPEQIIRPGSGRFPEIDFNQGECTFCAECVDACKSGALLRSVNDAPWRLAPEINQRCLAHNRTVCRACGERCEPEAITFRLVYGGIATPRIDEQACTGCGACQNTCPVNAIMIRPVAGPAYEDRPI